MVVDIDRSNDMSALATKQYDLELATLKEELKVAKSGAKEEVVRLKEDQKAKVVLAKVAIADHKAAKARAKATKRVDFTECMALPTKTRAACKVAAVAKLEAILKNIELQISKMDAPAVIKAEFGAQITGAKEGSVITEKKDAIFKLKEMMDGFKLQLKETRVIANEKKGIAKEKRQAYKELAADLNERVNDTDDASEKKEIRKEFGPAVKTAKKEAANSKTDAYTMTQALYVIRLKMKRARVADYSPSKMLISKCKLDSVKYVTKEVKTVKSKTSKSQKSPKTSKSV